MLLAVTLSAGDISLISGSKNTERSSAARLSAVRCFEGIEDAALVKTSPLRVPDGIRSLRRSKGSSYSFAGLLFLSLCIYAFIYLKSGKSESSIQHPNHNSRNRSIILYIHKTDGQKDDLLSAGK